MDLERKREQSYQGLLYVRFLCFGNGALTALHDRSDGFFRRQIIPVSYTHLDVYKRQGIIYANQIGSISTIPRIDTMLNRAIKIFQMLNISSISMV